MPNPFIGVLEVLRWTRSFSEGWKRREEEVLWRRVLMTSRGWTARVEIVPAERPAMVSTSAEERRAWFSFISRELGSVLSWWSVAEEEQKFFGDDGIEALYQQLLPRLCTTSSFTDQRSF